MAENEEPNVELEPNPEPKGTSADIVSGKWPAIVKKLEVRISQLEDGNKQILNENKLLRGQVETLARVPSKVLPGKSLLDELNEFLFTPDDKTNPKV